jgi:hypothetical protein
MARYSVSAGGMGIPMVLRKIPPARRHLAEHMTGYSAGAPTDTWWELVDTAASDDDPPAAAALSRLGTRGCTRIVVFKLGDTAGTHTVEDLLAALVAALRQTDATSVSVHAAGEIPPAALRSAGFRRQEQEEGSTERYVVAL